MWASLAVQWLRIRLPVQGSPVQSPVQEDPTSRGATESACCSYLAHALQQEVLAMRGPGTWRVAPLASTRESPRSNKDGHSQQSLNNPIRTYVQEQRHTLKFITTIKMKTNQQCFHTTQKNAPLLEFKELELSSIIIHHLCAISTAENSRK